MLKNKFRRQVLPRYLELELNDAPTKQPQYLKIKDVFSVLSMVGVRPGAADGNL